jgi:hypothetical protein
MNRKVEQIAMGCKPDPYKFEINKFYLDGPSKLEEAKQWLESMANECKH